MFDIQLDVGHGLLNKVIENAVERKGKSMVVVAVKLAKPLVNHDFPKG